MRLLAASGLRKKGVVFLDPQIGAATIPVARTVSEKQSASLLSQRTPVSVFVARACPLFSACVAKRQARFVRRGVARVLVRSCVVHQMSATRA